VALVVADSHERAQRAAASLGLMVLEPIEERLVDLAVGRQLLALRLDGHESCLLGRHLLVRAVDLRAAAEVAQALLRLCEQRVGLLELLLQEDATTPRLLLGRLRTQRLERRDHRVEHLLRDVWVVRAVFHVEDVGELALLGVELRHQLVDRRFPSAHEQLSLLASGPRQYPERDAVRLGGCAVRELGFRAVAADGEPGIRK
jgi:hypothetical protein